MLLRRVIFLVTWSSTFIHLTCALKLEGASSVYMPVDSVRPKLTSLEHFLRNFTNRAIKEALPPLLKALEKANVSSPCLSSLMKYVSSLRQIKLWAMRMLDASAKLPSGIFVGTVTEFGAFDECLQILVKDKTGMEDFRGKYCSVEVMAGLNHQPKNFSLALKSGAKFDDSIMEEMSSTIFAFRHLNLRFGICIPSSCRSEDLQSIGDQVLKPFKYGVKVKKCHISQDIEVEPIHIAVLSVIMVLIVLIVAASLLEWQHARDQEVLEKPRDIGLLENVLLCFSAATNTRRLLKSKSSGNEIQALHGIRALSMTWVILGHTYIWRMGKNRRSGSATFAQMLYLLAMKFLLVDATFIYLNGKSSQVSDWFNNIEFEVILNGWLSVSSFIFLSGLLTTYTTLNYMEGTKGKINIFSYIVRRFLRLFPSLLFVLGAVFFLPWITAGPFWPEIPGTEVENCRQFWWTNILFINNWRPITQMCLQHSWYISADFQLHILAIFILIPLYRNVLFGFSIASLMTLGSMIAIGLITYVNDYDPTILLSTANPERGYRIAEDIHVKTFTYFGPYTIGVATAYIILRFGKIRIPTIAKITGWIIASILSISALYGTHKWNIGEFHGPLVTAVYAALHRTVFIMGVAWVAFMCTSGNSGIISCILQIKPFVILSRLTFMAYLVQGLVIWTRYGSLKERIFYSHFNMLYEYFGNLCLSLAIAFAAHILVEAPFANLERLLFSGWKKKKEDSEKSFAQ